MSQKRFNLSAPIGKMNDDISCVFALTELYNSTVVDFELGIVAKGCGELDGEFGLIVGVDGDAAGELGCVAGELHGWHGVGAGLNGEDTGRRGVAFFVAVAEETVVAVVGVSSSGM
jgi:hypothetical protein